MKNHEECDDDSKFKKKVKSFNYCDGKEVILADFPPELFLLIVMHHFEIFTNMMWQISRNIV